MAKKKGENLYCPNQRTTNKKFRDGYDGTTWDGGKLVNGKWVTRRQQKDNAQS